MSLTRDSFKKDAVLFIIYSNNNIFSVFIIFCHVTRQIHQSCKTNIGMTAEIEGVSKMDFKTGVQPFKRNCKGKFIPSCGRLY